MGKSRARRRSGHGACGPRAARCIVPKTRRRLLGETLDAGNISIRDAGGPGPALLLENYGDLPSWGLKKLASSSRAKMGIG